MSYKKRVSIPTFLMIVFLISCNNNPQNKLDKTAEKMNRDLPKQVDSETKLLSVYTNDMEMVFEYELINLTSKEAHKEAIKNSVRPVLQTRTCPELKKQFFKNGVSVRYIYKGSDDGLIMEFLFQPGDC